jgi:hypothetical protein
MSSLAAGKVGNDAADAVLQVSAVEGFVVDSIVNWCDLAFDHSEAVVHFLDGFIEFPFHDHVILDESYGLKNVLCDLDQGACSCSIVEKIMWQLIPTAPFGCDLELAVIDGGDPHALVFPCRRILGGWIKIETNRRIEVHPTHWRLWESDTASLP